MVNPCCGGMALQKGTLAMALLSVMRGLFCNLATATFLGVYIFSKDTIFKVIATIPFHVDFFHLPSQVVIALATFMLGVFTLEIPLYSSLAVFAFKGDQARCDWWWRLKCVLLGVSVVVGVVAMVFSEDRVLIGAFLVAVVLYDMYLICVTRAYAQSTTDHKGK